MNRPLLFEKHPEVAETIPWVELGTFPTPVHRLSGLGESLGHPSLWIKRDDHSSDMMGGNKVRIMEFLLAKAQADGKTVAISPGPLGSNQVMASTIYGRELGIKIIGVLFKQHPTDYMLKHMLIDRSVGAELHHASSPYVVAFHILYQYLRNFDFKNMKAPFIIPSMGSSAACALGYLEGMLELKEQVESGECPEPDYIFVAAGTCGTMAGMELGARLLGLKTKVVGVRITDWISCNERIAANIVNRCYRLLKHSGANLPPFKSKPGDIMMIHDFFGNEYARPTDQGIEAKDLSQQTDQITLDNTYTAKTMAAMTHFIRGNNLSGKHLLFWHTFNTRDLSNFLDREITPESLPEPLRDYYK